MLTPAELAAHYRVSERTIARMTADGMPSRLVGSRRRYDLAETDAWTKGRATRLEVGRLAAQAEANARALRATFDVIDKAKV